MSFNKPFSFDAHPDNNPDPGIFNGIFTIYVTIKWTTVRILRVSCVGGG